MSKRLFIGTFPTGISYADRERERDGDYLRLAFLPFKSLKLEWARGVKVPTDLRAEIELHALDMELKRGQLYKISGAGQTVRLGS